MVNLSELLRQIEAGFYVVPEIQRSFVWRNPQVRDLAASVYSDFPIGAIIYWEMPNDFTEEYGDLIRPLTDDLRTDNGRYMVIDGQQRLTSLLLLKRGHVTVGRRQRRINLFFNPVQERFELARGRGFQRDPFWFNVSEVLSSEDEYEVVEEKARALGGESISRNRAVLKGLRRLRERFSTYDVPLVRARLEYDGNFLVTFEKISKIFVNLNSKGTRIKMPDLALALLTGRTRRDLGESFRGRFGEILQRLEGEGFDVDEPTIIRLYLAISTGTTKFNQAREVLSGMGGQSLLEALNSTDKAAFEAVRLLSSEMGVRGSRFLQSKYLLVPIAYLLHREALSRGGVLREDLRQEVTRWLILASAKKRYTGRLESELNEDISAIRRGEGVGGLLKNLGGQALPISALEGEYERYHLTLLLALYHRAGSRDWDLNSRLNPFKISDLAQSELHVHHIFPKDLLDRSGLKDLWDDFSNITLISRRANERIGRRYPAEYLGQLSDADPELLRTHFVPLDGSLWTVEKYEEFLRERRRLISDAVRDVLGIRLLKEG